VYNLASYLTPVIVSVEDIKALFAYHKSMKSFIFYELKYIRERNLELRALHPLFSAQHFAWIAYPFSDSAAMSCSQTINYRNKNIGTITRFMNMTLDLLNGLTCKVFLKAASNSPPQPRLSFFIKN
jgi:hypothetical protein